VCVIHDPRGLLAPPLAHQLLEHDLRVVFETVPDLSIPCLIHFGLWAETSLAYFGGIHDYVGMNQNSSYSYRLVSSSASYPPIRLSSNWLGVQGIIPRVSSPPARS